MKQLIYISFFSMLAIIYACRKDFVVDDIRNKILVVNAPADNLITTNNVITFWWEPLDGAEKYNLQVVQPNFAVIASLIADTNVTGTKFNLTLQPGVYQWRIKATNAGHSTAFQTFSLRIDTTTDLSGQVVNMLTPANGTLTGNKVQVFTWSSLPAAKKYRIQVNNGVIIDSTVTKTSLTVTLTAVAGNTTAYTWNVKAINDNSETQFNPVSFSFTVDLKPPSAPSLTSPLKGFSVRDTTYLVWGRNNPFDISHDSIYVATDSAFTNVISQTWVNQTKIRIAELENPPSIPSTYWWKVRSFDVAGNRSNFSAVLSFKLIP
jgi:hypothetical protein